MSKVKTENIYLTAKSKKLFDKIDFADTFSTTNHHHNLQEISNLVFNTSPKWLIILFKIRNSIAKLIGLKTDVSLNYKTTFEVGSFVKFFKIYNIAENEVILGANDKHLNFRAIINKTNNKTNNIKVTTLVKYNNTLGEIYMTIIKPFHKLVVKKMVSYAYYQ